MNFGQRGRDLVLECHRGGKNGGLLEYNATLVRGCLEEITWHVDELNHIVESLEDDTENNDGKPPINVRPSMFLHDAAIRRNKQCLLAYINHRVDIIRKSSSSSLSTTVTATTATAATRTAKTTTPNPSFGLNDKINDGNDNVLLTKSLLSEAEQDFFHSYSSLRDDYSQTMGLDLRSSHCHRRLPPPLSSSSMQQVRVLAPDMGTLVLGDGMEVHLAQGSIHYLPTDEIQEFVESGDLQQLDGEEILG